MADAAHTRRGYPAFGRSVVHDDRVWVVGAFFGQTSLGDAFVLSLDVDDGTLLGAWDYDAGSEELGQAVAGVDRGFVMAAKQGVQAWRIQGDAEGDVGTCEDNDHALSSWTASTPTSTTGDPARGFQHVAEPLALPGAVGQTSPDVFDETCSGS